MTQKRASHTQRSKSGLLQVIISNIAVSCPGVETYVPAKAIWDTGSTHSAITKAVAEKLNILPTGRTRIFTASGIEETNTYTLDIMLPEVFLIKSIVATEVASFAGECDALIGMDIITLGDFSITNHKGNTCMSFRIPSGHEIDYVKSPDYGIVEVVKLDQSED